MEKLKNKNKIVALTPNDVKFYRALFEVEYKEYDISGVAIELLESGENLLSFSLKWSTFIKDREELEKLKREFQRRSIPGLLLRNLSFITAVITENDILPRLQVKYTVTAVDYVLHM